MSLSRAGINNLEDLINRKEADLDSIRNLGKKGKIEVIERVKSLGVEFIKYIIVQVAKKKAN